MVHIHMQKALQLQNKQLTPFRCFRLTSLLSICLSTSCSVFSVSFSISKEKNNPSGKSFFFFFHLWGWSVPDLPPIYLGHKWDSVPLQWPWPYAFKFNEICILKTWHLLKWRLFPLRLWLCPKGPQPKRTVQREQCESCASCVREEFQRIG